MCMTMHNIGIKMPAYKMDFKALNSIKEHKAAACQEQKIQIYRRILSLSEFVCKR